MPRVSRLLFVLALALGVALAISPARAQIRIEPIPPHVKPRWTPVPGVPQVYYAPNLPTDVFRYRGEYYFFWEDYLYKGNKPRGPWKLVQEVPAPFHDIDPAYFKTAKKAKPPAAPPETVAPPESTTPPEAAAPAQPEPTPEAPASPEAAPAGGPEKPPKVR